jgi:4'-phosphopantetheinyl transferase
VTGRLAWLARGEASLPADPSWLAAGEVARAAGMRFTKHRTEYLLRRWAAKHAIAAEAGLSADPEALARIEVRNAPNGAPLVWVDGRRTEFGVSLTDRAGWAVCLVSGRPVQVGCDLELVEPRSAGFVRDFLTEAEQALVGAAGSEAERQVLANLVWSAKESALKVLQTGLRRDTRSVEVQLSDPATGPGSWAGLVVHADEDRGFPGWWCRHGPFLLTVAYDVAAPPPVSLEEPTALSSAEPLHSWVTRPV